MTGAQLKAVRERLHLSQPALGREVGALLDPPRDIPGASVNRWERGKRPVPEWLAMALERIEANRASQKTNAP